MLSVIEVKPACAGRPAQAGNKVMTFNEYQKQAKTTALYKDTVAEDKHLIYTVLGLVGESGEFAEKIKKLYRDKGGKLGAEEKAELVKELGDVLWYAASIASELGVSLGDVAQINADKLQSRRDRGKVQGEGDNR